MYIWFGVGYVECMLYRMSKDLTVAARVKTLYVILRWLKYMLLMYVVDLKL